MKFFYVRVRTAIVVHGYTDDNKEIVEEFADEPMSTSCWRSSASNP